MTIIHRTGRRLAPAGLVILLLAALAPAAATADEHYDREMKRGQAALDDGAYREAARAFEQARDRADGEREEAEARYWHAFALHRVGGKEELRRAARELVALQDLDEVGRLAREARSLAVRVKGDLARSGDARAARDLAELAERQEDDELKLAALQAMMHMKPERALPMLEKIVQRRDEDSAELRAQAMFLLGQQDSEKATELMIEVAREDPDPEVREQAIFWLGQSDAPAALAFFKELIREEQDPEVLEKAMFALSQVDDAEARAILRDIAADPDRGLETRQMAVFGLGQGGSREDREFLRQLFASVEEEELRERVLFAVAQGDGPGTAEWLLEIALDDAVDLETRKMALFWAGQQGLVPVARLTEIYDTTDDREMRGQVVFVLAQDGSEEAVQQLIDIARNEEDTELRKQAVFWIGQSGAEGAEDVLLEIISE